MEEEKTLTIKSWAEEDRPREKLLLKGRHVLSDAELIAILIGSGTRKKTAVELAKEILHTHGNNLNELAKLSVKDLEKFGGIGQAKAISIIAALELGRRRKDTEPQKRIKIITSKDAYEILRADLIDLPHEEFFLLLLNRANTVIGKKQISKGGVSGTIVDAKIIFLEAVENKAVSIVLAHNHPSGNLKPSEQDIRLTKSIKEAGNVLEISVIDHLIISNEGYFSFADEGMI